MFCSNCGANIEDNARFCGNCGQPVASQPEPQSAIPQQPYAPPSPQYIPPPQQQYAPGPQAGTMPSSKSKTAAALLCFFLGVVGAHLFYVGKVGAGIFRIILFGIGYILMFAGVGVAAATKQAAVGGAFSAIGYILVAVMGIVTLVEFIKILLGKFKDSHNQLLK